MATEPQPLMEWILFQNITPSALLHAVQIKWSVCHSLVLSSYLVLAATDKFQVCHANGCQFSSHLGVFHFRNSDCLHVSIRGTSFSLL